VWSSMTPICLYQDSNPGPTAWLPLLRHIIWKCIYWSWVNVSEMAGCFTMLRLEPSAYGSTVYCCTVQKKR